MPDVYLDAAHRYWRTDAAIARDLELLRESGVSVDQLEASRRSLSAEVPGVTGTLSRAGLIDYTGVPRDVLARKAAIGTAVHKAAWYYDDGDLDPASVAPEIAGYLLAWQRYVAESRFRSELRECQVYSPRYGYAGTADRFGHLADGRPAIVDLKCVRTLQAGTGPQTAAYAEAAREVGLFDAAVRYAVKLEPNGRYDVRVYPDHDGDFAAFLRALDAGATAD